MPYIHERESLDTEVGCSARKISLDLQPQAPNCFEPMSISYFHLPFFGHLNYSFPISVLLNMNEAGEVWPRWSITVFGAGYYL